MRPQDALQMQVDLRAALRHPDWEPYMDSFLARVELQASLPSPVASGDLPEDRLQQLMRQGWGRRWLGDEGITLAQAETFIIAEHMNPLIRMAAADYPDDKPFEVGDPPSPFGFMVFEKAWETVDAYGKVLKTKAITWRTGNFQGKAGGPGTSGAYITEYSSWAEPDDITNQLLTQDPAKVRALRAMGDLSVHHVTGIGYGRTMGTHVGAIEGWDEQRRDAAVEPVKAVLAAWHLMREPYVDVNRPKIAPKAAATWKRKRIPGAVSVITLRQKYTPTGERGGVEHDHRWPVRGHWAWRWRGPMTGERTRHRVYIHPHLRGPEGAPVRDTKHVHRLSR